MLSTFVSIQTGPRGRFQAVKVYGDDPKTPVAVITLADTKTRTVKEAFRVACVGAYIRHRGQADWPGIICSSTVDHWEADHKTSLTDGMSNDEFADSCRAEASRICQAAAR